MTDDVTARHATVRKLPTLTATFKIELDATGRSPINSRPDRPKQFEVLPHRLHLTYIWDPRTADWKTGWVVVGWRRLNNNRWSAFPSVPMSDWHVQQTPDWILDAVDQHQPRPSVPDPDPDPPADPPTPRSPQSTIWTSTTPPQTRPATSEGDPL